MCCTKNGTSDKLQFSELEQKTKAGWPSFKSLLSYHLYPDFFEGPLCHSYHAVAHHTLPVLARCLTHFKPVTAFWYFEGAPETQALARLCWVVTGPVFSTCLVMDCTLEILNLSKDNITKHLVSGFCLSVYVHAHALALFGGGCWAGGEVETKRFIIIQWFSPSATLRKL
jgi:hypothetical protein